MSALTDFSKILLDFAGASEDKTGKIVSKLFYLLNCFVISVWAVGTCGYSLDKIIGEPEFLVHLFTRHYLISFILIFLFVHFISAFFVEMIAGIFSKTVLPWLIFRKTKIEKFNLSIIYTHDKKFKSSSKPFLETTIELEKKRITNDEELVYPKYLTYSIITTVFVYYFIVIVNFRGLNFLLVDILLWTFAIISLIFLAEPAFREDRLREYNKVMNSLNAVLRMIEDRKKLISDIEKYKNEFHEFNEQTVQWDKMVDEMRNDILLLYEGNID